MQSLAAKYTKLKKSVGGNREKTRYEESFGPSFEEYNNVTPPGKWQIRILSEIEFSIHLSEVNDHIFDEIVGKTIDFLMDCVKSEGTITNSDCMKAEEMLRPLEVKSKEYNLILAAHAHIDMNWMWGWQETVEATLATFRTMLKLMREYPDFCFSQSQASVYKIVEDYAPEMMDEIKQRIKEGRWEITASACVETDKNMPGTESLLNHIKYTKEYLERSWEVDPDSIEVDFSPDTFGHSANIPEINRYGNIKYYYHCRGLDGDSVLFRWRAPSGKEVLTYREQYWYNSGITPFAGIGLIDISKRCAGLKTGLIVYGVGDHGGGPTRKDIEKALEMNEWPIFPSFKFGTMKEFFKIAESLYEEYPVINDEINFFATGCYTTQSRIKLGNRKCEAALAEAHFWNSLASVYSDFPYNFSQFEKAWQNVLFTHFHDILTGSCVQDTREHAMALYADAMAVANTRISGAVSALAGMIDTSSVVCDDQGFLKESRSEGAGAGYGMYSYSTGKAEESGTGVKRIFHLFNSGVEERLQPVEITIWDWPGDLRYINITDISGNILEHQLIDTCKKGYWSHEFFKVLVYCRVPAIGYTTIILDEAEPSSYKLYFQGEKRSEVPAANYILENEWLKAEFDYRSGELISYFEKSSEGCGREWLKPGCSAGLRYQESENATSNAWHIGNYTANESKLTLIKIKSLYSGPLKNGFEAEFKIKSSSIKLTICIDKNSKTLDYHINADWHEISGDKKPVPVLYFELPLEGEISSYLYDVPGGVKFRKPVNMDMPALKYAAAITEDDRAIALITDCKYGYRGVDNKIYSTLINSTYRPDLYPERGIHEINLSIAVSKTCPKVCPKACPVELEDLSHNIINTVKYQSAIPQKGSLPAEFSLLKFNGESTVLSSVTKSEDGALLVRVYETQGKKANVTVSSGLIFKSAETVDLDGNSNAGNITLTEHSVTFDVKPHSIQTIKLYTEYMK